MFLTMLGVNGPYPSAGGACSSYLVTSDSGKTNVVLDLGSGSLGRLMSEIGDLHKLDALIFSHLHYDHMSDALPLMYALDFTDIVSLKTICPDTPAMNRKLLAGKLDCYPPRDLTVGEMKIEFIPVKHPVETYAVKIICDGATLVYTADTNECDLLHLFASGCDTLLADCGLSDEDYTKSKPHLSPKTCGELAMECKAKNLILTHLSPRYEPEALLDACLEVCPYAELAQAGLRVRV